eukprot:4344982-Amphidinium_carterae.1
MVAAINAAGSHGLTTHTGAQMAMDAHCKQDQHSVLAACGAYWSASDIESALKLLYHDTHMQDRNNKKLFYHPSTPKGKENDQKGKGKPQGVLQQDEVVENEQDALAEEMT